MNNLIKHISNHTNKQFQTVEAVSGGSISSAYRLKWDKGTFFLKVNTNKSALEMFIAEEKGLKAIEQTNTISVPKVNLVDEYDKQAFLLMDYIEGKLPNAANFKTLGKQLAQLHLNYKEAHGFTSDNFIGSLTQQNNQHSEWCRFYWYERIAPQLKLAKQKQLIQSSEYPSEQNAINIFKELLGQDIKPSILHGDLWAGNYLIASDDTPYLVDPATFWGHSMVDIAMSKLFGGFANDFYTAYHNIIPKTINYNAQIDLYQLYFLLVHLNLFGSIYYGPVSSILKEYF